MIVEKAYAIAFLTGTAYGEKNLKNPVLKARITVCVS
jgi:hypothetical protein